MSGLRLAACQEQFGLKIAWFVRVACSPQPNRAMAGNGVAGERPAFRFPGGPSPNGRASRRHSARRRVAAGMVDDSLGADLASARLARGGDWTVSRRLMGRALVVAATARSRHRALRFGRI